MIVIVIICQGFIQLVQWVFDKDRQSEFRSIKFCILPRVLVLSLHLYDPVGVPVGYMETLYWAIKPFELISLQ